MDSNISLVFDLGYTKYRIGYAGDDKPRIDSDSYYAVNSKMNDKMHIDSTDAGKEKILFDTDLHNYNVDYRYESILKQPYSYTYNDSYSELYNNEILGRLNLTSKSVPILISEDNILSKLERYSVIQMYLEDNLSSSVFLLRRSILSMYSCGKTNGLVLDSSSYTTSISTIEEGYFVSEGYSKINYGGETITDKISSCLKEDYINILPDHMKTEENDFNLLDDTFFEYERRVFARKIKNATMGGEGILMLI